MTEVEVIEQLKWCINSGRDNCHMETMKAAVQVIEMQKQAIKTGVEQQRRLEQDIKSLRAYSRTDFTKEGLVKRINEVIEQAVYHGGDSGGSYDSNFSGLFMTIKDLLRYIDPEKELLMAIERDTYIPEIQFRK